jgi:hypothetical protein
MLFADLPTAWQLGKLPPAVQDLPDVFVVARSTICSQAPISPTA